MKILRWILRKSNWICHISCKNQFRGKCYKKPPVDIVPIEYFGSTRAECKEVKK